MCGTLLKKSGPSELVAPKHHRWLYFRFFHWLKSDGNTSKMLVIFWGGLSFNHFKVVANWHFRENLF